MTTPPDPLDLRPLEPRPPERPPDRPPERPPERPPRRLLTSGRLAAGLALVAVVLLAIAVLPGLSLPRIIVDWGGGTATPTAAPTTAPSSGPSPSTSAEPSFGRPTPTAQPTFTSHTVRTGDSLNSIAALYNTKARSIAWWNRGTYPSLDPESPGYNPGRIEVGWVLVLIPGVLVDDLNPPSPSPGRATPTRAASASPGSASPGSASPAASRAPGSSP